MRGRQGDKEQASASTSGRRENERLEVTGQGHGSESGGEAGNGDAEDQRTAVCVQAEDGVDGRMPHGVRQRWNKGGRTRDDRTPSGRRRSGEEQTNAGYVQTLIG